MTMIVVEGTVEGTVMTMMTMTKVMNSSEQATF
jgi:hypothetical protein